MRNAADEDLTVVAHIPGRSKGKDGVDPASN